MLRIDRSEFVPFPLERVAQFISAVDQLNTFNILQWWWRMRWYLPIHEVYFCVDSLLTHPRCALHTAWKRNKRVKAAWNFASAAFSLRFIFTCGGSALYHWVSLTYMQGLLTHLAHLCCRKKYKKVVFFFLEMNHRGDCYIMMVYLTLSAEPNCLLRLHQKVAHTSPAFSARQQYFGSNINGNQPKKKEEEILWQCQMAYIFFTGCLNLHLTRKLSVSV